MAIKLLSHIETRVIGCLVEKSLTTPDQYPLSLNALTNACNQKSNREPIVSYAENEVLDTLEALEEAGLVSEVRFGGRVAKYQHRFCNTEFGELQLNEQELGVICVLFLRGPQTPGELRTRTNRMCVFKELTDVERTLDGLASRSVPLVIKFAREPGKRESRYGHLLSGDDVYMESDSIENNVKQAEPDQLEQDVLARIQTLEAHVAQLQERVDELEALILSQ